MPLQKNCRNCAAIFEITDSDQAFYAKMAVPPPTHCPSCRQQRRLAFRNERNLFRRSCDLCKKEIVTFFAPGAKFPVYCSVCWWSDRWDPLSYGQDFDFSKPFFPQFQELLDKVPKMAVLQLANENSDYNTLLAYSKNTYMSPGSYFMEDSYYCRKSQYCKDCMNSQFLDHCELVTESTNCKKCYQGDHLINCRNCSDCSYVADSSSCQNCFMCSGLNKKNFHFKNKPLSEGEYRRMIGEYRQRNPADLLREFQEFNQTIPKKYQNQINCENSSGDYIQSCKNATECYDCFDVEDAKYLMESVTVKDSMDLSMHDKDIQLCYECCSGGESNMNLKFSFCTIASANSEYLYSCFYLPDSFGCDGFHAKQNFCILNKKYSQQEYVAMKKKIVDHMMKNGEYGEFFPISISTHAYNHSNAFDLFPLTKEEALQKGYRWVDRDPANYQAATAQVPASIDGAKDSITKEIFACTSTLVGAKNAGLMAPQLCGKNYRVTIQELQLSRKMGVALSRFCGDCRQLQLQALKNPRKLWKRACSQCGKAIETTFAPERPEKVYCEKCYLQEIY